MQVAYLYYYAYTTNKLIEIIKYALYYAKELAEVKFDVFNCLNIMENGEFAPQLKFGIGDGTLNFYMYNYGLKNGFLQPHKLATVLV